MRLALRHCRFPLWNVRVLELYNGQGIMKTGTIFLEDTFKICSKFLFFLKIQAIKLLI